jgi:membrane protease YdiL (CAAX protease family)
MPSIPDHILFLVIAIVLPVYSVRTWKSFQKELARKKPFALRNGYIETLVVQWSLAIGLLVWWWYRERSFNDLGFSFYPDLRNASSIVLTLLGCIFFIKQWIEVKNLHGAIPDSLKKQIEPIAELIPETAVEQKLFFAAALTAGFCEELLYRGFLLWYATAYTHWFPAVLAAILIFGFAHTYQGTQGIVKATMMAIVMVGLYLLSGSLLGPMLLHAVVDVTSGFIGVEVKKTTTKAESATNFCESSS